MGLTVSHNAFDGAYSAFKRLRIAVIKAANGSYPPHRDKVNFPDNNCWYVDDEYTRENYPGLWAFLEHSDCDGEIPWQMCGNVATDLRVLLNKVTTNGEGHLAKLGTRGTLLKFIEGCELASQRHENLLFR